MAENMAGLAQQIAVASRENAGSAAEIVKASHNMSELTNIMLDAHHRTEARRRDRGQGDRFNLQMWRDRICSSGRYQPAVRQLAAEARPCASEWRSLRFDRKAYRSAAE